MKVLTFRKGQLEEEFTKLGYSVFFCAQMHRTDESRRIQHVLKTLNDVKPDIMFFMKDEKYLTKRVVHAIKNKFPKTKFVMWYGDQRGGVSKLVRERLPTLDMLLINNADPKQIKLYKKAGIKHVHTLWGSFIPAAYRPRGLAAEHTVLFGGGNYNHKKFPLGKFRHKLINTVRKNFKTVVYGNGWNFPTRKPVRHAQYGIALNKALFNLGANHYSVTRYYDTRIFQCMPTGRMHITHYVPGMEKDFENHKHLVWFKSIPECLDIIKYYSKNYGLAEKIGLEAIKLCNKRHTMGNRAASVHKLFTKFFS